MCVCMQVCPPKVKVPRFLSTWHPSTNCFSLALITYLGLFSVSREGFLDCCSALGTVDKHILSVWGWRTLTVVYFVDSPWL